ncbi:MAG: restriction endonuclease subunit S [Thermoleophilia bacterium]
MIADLKPYPAYKGSGVTWLEEVPEHWEVRKLRHILKRRTERNRLDLPLLSVVREKGVILRDTTSADENHNFIPDDLSNYKVVRAGQFAMNKMKAWQGSYGVSPYDGIVSPAYFVFDLGDIAGPFFNTAIRSRAYVPSFTQASDGVRIGQWDLSETRTREIPFLLPPLPEQAAIVRLLDHADRRIRRYIRAKQKLIKLLEEQKQAIIHRAVTRGLDPNVRLKPSGVEWLGDVPEHWEVRRLKEVSLVQTGITLGKSYGSAPLIELPYLRVANVQTGHLDLGKITTVRVPPEEARRSTLEPGDVLMTEGGDIDKLGRGCVWQGEIPGCLHQNHVFAVRPRRVSLLPGFLVALMGSEHGRNYFQVTAKQTTNLASTNSTTLGNFPLRLPDVDEQQYILDWIDERADPLDKAVRDTHREIDLLREYRTRLIADVVTGKLDVREAAARLPEEVEEPEPLDEIEGESDAEGTDADATDEAPEEGEA